MGYILGVLCALFSSFQHRAMRVAKDVPVYQINAVRFLFSTFLFAVLLLLFGKFHIPIELSFWTSVGIIVFFETLLAFTYVRAFQLSDQSLVGPLFGISPIFLIPLGFFFLSETYSVWGILGVIFVFVGSIQFLWKSKHSIKEMIQSALSEKGPMYMIISAFLASFAVLSIKKGMDVADNVLVLGFAVSLSLFIIYIIITIWKLKLRAFSPPRSAFIVALFFSFVPTTQYAGLYFLEAAYFISVKRLSIVSDVLVGKFLGQEGDFKKRLIGALFIFTGVLLFLLWG